MSYGSVVCTHCRGEVRVYVEGDGSFSGTCPTCGKYIGSWKDREPIPDEGAQYDVFVTEDTLQDGEWVRTSTHELIRTYTTMEQAQRLYDELMDPRAEKDGTHRTWVMVLKRRGEMAEWVLPEAVRGCRL